MYTTQVSAAAVEQQLPSRDFIDRWLSERGLDKESGVLLPLPPRWLPSTSAFLGGSGVPAPCFLLCTHDAEGNRREELSRERRDTPNPKERYRCPPGSGSVIYAPLPESFAEFDSATEKHICEGEGKTMAIGETGRAALGIGGVQNWRGRDGKLHGDLASRIRLGDTATLWIDGDWRDNRGVHVGAYLLMEAVRELGAKVLFADLPPVPGIGKVGIDDLIADWKRRGLDVEAQLAKLTYLEDLPSPFVVDLSKPLDTAENFLSAKYDHADRPTLLHWQGEFFAWTGPGWERRAEELLREELYDFVREHKATPKNSNVSSLLDALRAAAQARIKDAPAWLGDSPQELDDVLPVANGLLRLSTRELLPPTPRYFNLNWSDVAFDPSADCPRWERFLAEIYPDDPSARDCLQEFLGYSLTDDTRQQKAIALIGDKRSGKGTIARVLQHLVGRNSCCAPTLQSMGERFGFQTWIGKKVAIVGDARTSVRHDGQAMVERVLAITGEDTAYVDRKNQKPWEGRLRTRLWLMSNMLPATSDKGGALASRFLILPHDVSFYGREDTGLEASLEAEASGILNWTLAGLERLRERGYFVQPVSGAEALKDWERINSPMLSFVEERCAVGPELFVPKETLRGAYTSWLAQNGAGRGLSIAQFTNELKGAMGHRVTTGQRRIDGKKTWVFVGLALRTDHAPKY